MSEQLLSQTYLNEQSDNSTYTLSIELSGLPKRFNQGQGSHWSVRYRESQKWHKRLLGKMILNRSSAPPSPLTKAHLTLIRHSSRAPDYDGLVQSMKPVIDALKKCGVIIDDNMSVIGRPEYQWKKAKQKEGRIEVIVKEVRV